MKTSEWVVKNGPWFLSEGPDWSVSTWVTDVRMATKYRTRILARAVALEARANEHRPFGFPAEDAVAVRSP